MTRRTSDLLRDWLKTHGKGSVREFVLGVPPVPASRPRVTRWGTYYSKTYERFRKAAETFLFGTPGKPSKGPLVVLLECVVAKPKTTKRDYPRGDTDNYAKAILDAMTKAGPFFEDDDQVTALMVTKRFAEPDEEPRTIINWYEETNDA